MTYIFDVMRRLAASVGGLFVDLCILILVIAFNWLHDAKKILTK